MAGKLDMGHARALLALAAGAQTAAAARVVAQGLSVRDTERLVAPPAHPGEAAGAARRATRRSRPRAARGRAGRIARREGAQSSPGAAARGRLVIAYSSLEQLDGILARVRGPAH